MIMKKLFIIVMSYNMPETMTKQRRYCEKNREKRLEKGR